jgi:hypothetical protein
MSALVDAADSATLDVCGDERNVSTNAEDIARAIDAKPLEEDWYVSLTLPNEDVMEAYLDKVGEPFTLDVEVGKQYLVAGSPPVDVALLKEILASFLAGDGRWRDMAQWNVPPAPKPAPAIERLFGKWILAIPVAVTALIIFGEGRWAIAAGLVALPFAFAGVILSKLREVKAATTWTRGTARIVRSEQVMEKRNDREVPAARIEFEYTVTFDKYRGNRVSIGEIVPGSPEVAAALKRYPMGGSATVYYDPKKPQSAVLERDLPQKFGLIWIMVAIVAVACLTGAWYLVRPAG